LQTGQGENAQVTALAVAPDVYKNFEFRSDADAPELINKRSSHRNWIIDSNAADYEHVSAADITLKTHYFFNTSEIQFLHSLHNLARITNLLFFQ
jgi:hypothetical protein